MADDAVVAPSAAAATEASRPAIRQAGRVIVIAGALGVVGQLLFFDVGLGVNFPVAIALLAGGGWLLRRRRTAPARIDAWLAPAAIVFASFAAIRADPVLVAIDCLASLGLVGGALASFSGRTVVGRSFGALVALGVAVLGWAVGGAFPAGADARAQASHGVSIARRAAPAMPIIRGLLLAIPVVIVFVALFSSADAVFARVVDDLFGVEIDLGDVGWRLMAALVLAWVAAGSLALAASNPGPQAATAGGSRWRVGTTELVTVLLALDAVFAGFVILQAAYLFGGLDTLQASGLTYAEYARRGFFELVAVAVRAGGVIVGAERMARDRSVPLIASALTLTVLTAVVLVSAMLRLRLYHETYGWTELRLYVMATIIILAVAGIGLVVGLLANRVAWIGHLLIASTLAAGLVLNVIGPVRFITEQNVARVLDPSLVPPHGSSGIDETYAATLGDDAVPELIRALPALDPRQATYLREELGWRLDQLRGSDGLSAWQAWNAGRAGARDALESARARGDLP